MADRPAIEQFHPLCGEIKKDTKLHLPPLMETERSLIRDHAGCMWCCCLNIRHNFDECPMKGTNTWPDPMTYVTLTALAASTATKGEEKDDETDSYILSPPNILFTVNQLYTTLPATGPHITEFPIPIQALMDIGCPCTVINAELCDHLRLRWYLLPMRENNLSSLSQMLLNCEEYVKLELQLGKGEVFTLPHLSHWTIWTPLRLHLDWSISQLLPNC